MKTFSIFPRTINHWVIIIVSFFLFCLTVISINTARAGTQCISFGNMANGQSLPPNVTSAQIRQIFANACQQFSNIGANNGEVHWWEGLLVQDFFGATGQESGAIFYDVNVYLGGGQAYVLWGPVLQRYWGSSYWGPPQSNRKEVLSSPNGTHGHYVRFLDNLDVYYNERTGATYVIRGVTRDRFYEVDGASGFLGLPESEGLIAADSGYSGISGWYQNFEGGIMHTCQCNETWQAWEVHGAIQATYNSLSGVGSGSYLGFPLSGEINTGSSPTGTSGKYQLFEGGRVYYDSLSDNGTTFIIYKNIESRLPSGSGVGDSRLGFPIDKQQSSSDCRVYFELGYVDCQNGIQSYSSNQERPNVPSLSLPYAQNDTVTWTGGPHGYGAPPTQIYYDAGFGSGIDFGKNGQAFEVYAMTGGTVVEVVNHNCDASYSLGCRIAIRSDDGGTILIYSHLQLGSLKVTRTNQETNQPTSIDIKQGMYIFAREKIAIAGRSGQQSLIHLHIEFRDGTGRSCSNYYCYSSTTGRRFGYSMDWHNVSVGGYLLFGYENPSNISQRFNYDGSAVKGGVFQTKRINGYYIDSDNTRRLASMTVYNTFVCDISIWTCETLDGQGLTEFAGHGQLESLNSNDFLGAETNSLIFTEEGGQLISDHNGTVISYDPDFLNLASLVNQTTKIYLPVVQSNSSSNPPPTPTPTPTIPPPPPATELLGPSTNNGGFELGNMNGWLTPNGTVDVNGADVHSGSYSVHGSSGGDESNGEPPVVFYKDI